MELTTEFKQKVRDAALEARPNFDGSDDAYAKTLGINGAVYSRLKKGEIEGIISVSNWINMGRVLGVQRRENNWKVVETRVYRELLDNLTFCKENSKSMMFVDECDIGKSFCIRHIVKGMKNAFYLDCSQHKTKIQFTRALAKVLGIDNRGRYIDVKANVKYALVNLDIPVMVLDEFGDLEYPAFMDVKEYWNGTEGLCGWYVLGAEGLKTKLDNGFERKKVGFAEILSRFSDKVITIVPTEKTQRESFFYELLTDVASANVNDKKMVDKLVRQCLNKEKKLRHLDTLIRLQSA